MKKEFSEYLASIGIKDLFYQRVEEVYAFYSSDFLDEDVLDIFVTEYVDGEGRREYENLWFFTATSVMEAKQFLMEDKFDLMPIKDRVLRWEIAKRDYDFKEAAAKSRMRLQVFLDNDFVCDFKASQENCDFLRDIFLKYFKPNVVIASGSAVLE